VMLVVAAVRLTLTLIRAAGRAGGLRFPRLLRLPRWRPFVPGPASLLWGIVAAYLMVAVVVVAAIGVVGLVMILLVGAGTVGGARAIRGRRGGSGRSVDIPAGNRGDPYGLDGDGSDSDRRSQSS